VDPQTDLDDMQKRTFLTLPGLEPRRLDRPACPGTHCIEGWVGPRAGVDAVKKRNSLLQSGMEP
jgi:hypothetical protein